MRRIAILWSFGLAAALVSGCALETGERGTGHAEESTANEEQAFDASLFKLGLLVLDDGQGRGGGWQRAIATLKFIDTRNGFFGKS